MLNDKFHESEYLSTMQEIDNIKKNYQIFTSLLANDVLTSFAIQINKLQTLRNKMYNTEDILWIELQIEELQEMYNDISKSITHLPDYQKFPNYRI